jgi:hypothetical protein
MPNDNILAEHDFTISHKGVNYDIKPRAVFVPHGEKVGNYHIDFTFKDKTFAIWQPDKNLYSRERARRVAQAKFASGQVETHAISEIQSWINTGDVY